jgi:hypothetical protein
MRGDEGVELATLIGGQLYVVLRVQEERVSWNCQKWGAPDTPPRAP